MIIRRKAIWLIFETEFELGIREFIFKHEAL